MNKWIICAGFTVGGYLIGLATADFINYGFNLTNVSLLILGLIQLLIHGLYMREYDETV